ncbi:hypothetical protein KEM60_01472 [Austwickia sp. TVS 96-490-7B]|nr:hypothetical protein [Austwickia sp. TVS 96-490-7B]
MEGSAQIIGFLLDRDFMKSVEVEGSTLMSGMAQARRPSGPWLVMGAVVGTTLLGQGFLAVIPDPAAGTKPFWFEAALTFGFAVQLLLLLAWVRYREQRPLASLGLATHGAGQLFLRGAGIAVAFSTIIVLLNVMTGHAELTDFSGAALLPVAILLMGFMVQASTEEIMTRGYIMQGIAWKKGIVVAMVVQTVVFTALHLGNKNINPMAVLNLVLVSVFLGYWALAENGLWGVCAFHAVWNWSQGSLWGSPVSGMYGGTSLFRMVPDPTTGALLSGGSYGLEASVLVTVVLSGGIVVAYRAYRRRTAA